MSNTRYLEIDSSFRNRNEWPLPGKFEIPISQTGSKNINNALDPVSDSVPLQVWTSNNFTIGGGASLTGTILYTSAGPPTAPTIKYSSDLSTITIKCTANTMQQIYNYYYDCVITDTTVNVVRRINELVYLYTSGGFDVAQVTLSSPFPSTVNIGDGFSITDPTYLDAPSYLNPYIFVPFGRIQRDAYNNLILYNETRKQYRPINSYNETVSMLSLNTSGSITASESTGPVTGWTATDNYSIRIQPPFLANSSIITVMAGSTESTLLILINSSLIPLSDPTDLFAKDAYKNYSVRILPLDGGKYNYNYNFNLTPPINESTTIVSSFYTPSTNILTLSVYPPFNAVPETDSLIEIMSFTRDNLYPFVYTGSLVSQNEMVCYEIQLLNLVLPNSTLIVGEGGRIAFYPYVYVQLSNVSASGAGLKNVIYSNNPNATNVTFRAPIYDVQNPLITAFVKVDGDGMTQTIKFRPNDTLLFSVTLSNGEIYQTEITDNLSPALPNPLAQISALFSMKRL